LLSPAEVVRLSHQPPDPEWFDELQMLQRVQAFFERHPSADGCVRPYLTRLLDSPDPEVQRKLRDGAAFSAIALPLERLPLTAQEQHDEREVIEYIHRNEYALATSTCAGRIAELKQMLEPDDRPIPCPWCGTGELRAAESGTPEDDECTAFYYPQHGTREADGAIAIRASWYDGDGHSSGVLQVGPDDPDYGLWGWIIDRPRRFRRVMNTDLDDIRREFRQWQRGTLPWMWFRLLRLFRT
jgi:hypothetical protein